MISVDRCSRKGKFLDRKFLGSCRMLKLVAGAMMLSAVAISPVAAATLDGDNVTISYVLNGTSHVFGTFLVPDVAINVSQDPNGLGSISGNTVSYLFGQSVDFSAIGLTSVTIKDDNPAKRIDGIGYAQTNMVSGLINADLTLDQANNSAVIFLDGVTAQAGGSLSIRISADDVAPVVSAVPLPASAPMFGAALLTLGAVGYGMKRKAKAAA